MTIQRHAFTRPSEEEIERLLYHMPAAVSWTENTWAANFGRSIIRQANRRRWAPSPKQLNIMRTMVSDLFSRGVKEEGELQVIED
ncbi:MAG: hypothetical protein RIA08_21810 [Roseovarius sp.]|uniref:hypothetical protein n=1 Tax=Roseovarius sp. TaxID=1486281 RepID=UPI0032EFF94D